LFMVLENQQSKPFEFVLLTYISAHERIIWGCSWNFDDAYFATAARDKLVKVWKLDASKAKLNDVTAKHLCSLPAFSHTVTAVSWAPVSRLQRYMIAVGLEHGLISLWASKLEQTAEIGWAMLSQVNVLSCHADAIRRLQWRNPFERTLEEKIADKLDKWSLQLLSCSNDQSIRLFQFCFDN